MRINSDVRPRLTHDTYWNLTVHVQLYVANAPVTDPRAEYIADWERGSTDIPKLLASGVEYMQTIELRADETGTIELICERTAEDEPAPRIRSFSGRNAFGLLVDDLTSNERVVLYVDDTLVET